jgi:tetratricopeptide (TPR) repeat protein
MLDALFTSPAPAGLPAGANRERSLADIHVGERVRVQGSGLPLPDQGEGRGIAALKRLIIEKTEGNPFFMEEMVQNLFEEGALVRNGEVKLARPLAAIQIPTMVQAILASRIDRLQPPEKDLLQTLAVLGKQFTISEVKAAAASQHPHPRVTALAEKGTSAAPLAPFVADAPQGRLSLFRNQAGERQEELERMLSGLQLAEFIYEQPAAGDVEYIFKHALTQEVAYNSILAQRRKQVHERAAQAIESLFAASLADHYEDLARHYGRSGNTAKAVTYLHLAAEQAMNRSAYVEASGQLTAALELLQTQPDDIERDRIELAMRFSLAICLNFSVRDAFMATATADILERARQLCEKVGDDASRLGVLSALAFMYSNRLERQKAQAVCEELLEIGKRMHDSESIGRGRFWLGFSSLWEGNLSAALEEFDQAFQLPAGGLARREATFGHWRPLSRAFASLTLWLLGYPERATARSRESLEIARGMSIDSPSDLPSALVWSGLLNLLLRDPQTAGSQADEGSRLAQEHGLMALVSISGFIRAFTGLGQREEALSELLRWRAEASETPVSPWTIAGLAGFYLAASRPREGLETADEGLELIQRTGTRWMEAEMRRLKGELLLLSDHSAAPEAAQCFRDAIEVARRQSAKSWELRATMSLARLLAKQGRRAEAHTMLMEIHGWFTEGFDTADLKDAKALLDELGN